MALQVVERVTRENLHSKYTAFDPLSTCVVLKEKIPIDIAFTYVKGHQDNHLHKEELSSPTQLNILMDKLAKDLLRTNINKIEDFHTHSMMEASILYCRGPISQHYKDQLYERIMNNSKGHKY